MPFRVRFSSKHLYDSKGNLKHCVEPIPNKPDKFLLNVSAISLHIKYADKIEIETFNNQVTLIGGMKTVAFGQLILDVQDHEAVVDIV